MDKDEFVAPFGRRAHKVSRRYGDQPLGGYATVMGVFATAAVTLAGVAAATGRRIPRLTGPDVAALGLATFELSRLLAKDAVTSPLRAPLTELEGPAGAAEVNERVVADGHAHALGEMLTCPFCLSVWAAAGLSGGMVFAPRLTRFVTRGLAAVATSSFLHLAYDAAKRATGNTG
jgi:hypothetical protein